MGITVYEGAVYLDKQTDKGKTRTLHSRQPTAAQSHGVADEANTRAVALGIDDKGTYVAVAEHFVQET